uniref:Uncharacterized protein n=1 Tax=Heterorhabditis bacteriophora TaxID=37862 RepID=A0A1I7WWT1_HETBA
MFIFPLFHNYRANNNSKPVTNDF